MFRVICMGHQYLLHCVANWSLSRLQKLLQRALIRAVNAQRVIQENKQAKSHAHLAKSYLDLSPRVLLQLMSFLSGVAL